MKVECLLPKKYSYNNDFAKPVLTYFLTIVYRDDGKSFKLSNNSDEFATIQLKCLPNGILSKLFDYDIVQNFKTYSYFDDKDGFTPIFLTNQENEVEDKIKEFVKNNPKYVLINGRQKLGAFCNSIKHPYYGHDGISLFPVRRQKKNEKKARYNLEVVKNGHTNRISNKTLIERFDSHDKPWSGIKKYSIL